MLYLIIYTSKAQNDSLPDIRITGFQIGKYISECDDYVFSIIDQDTGRILQIPQNHIDKTLYIKIFFQNYEQYNINITDFDVTTRNDYLDMKLGFEELIFKDINNNNFETNIPPNQRVFAITEQMEFDDEKNINLYYTLKVDIDEAPIGVNMRFNVILTTDFGRIEQDLDIQIQTGKNSSPLNIMLTRKDIPENQGPNTIVGTFCSVDLDIQDRHKYQLMSYKDYDHSSFNIRGNTLRTNCIFDFERQSHYRIKVRSSDQKGNTYEKDFEIQVIDILDPFFIEVTGGTFQMGCENNCRKNETPVHEVVISSFLMSQYEITNAQYVTFLNKMYERRHDKLGRFQDPVYGIVQYINLEDEHAQIKWDGNADYTIGRNLSECPVIEVTWFGAMAYANWLGGYLPTEAEWEFAAHGGNTSDNYRFSGSDNAKEIAWYNENSINKPCSNTTRTHQIGTRIENALNIGDMSGNVWEWCSDWYDANYYSESSSENPKGPDKTRTKVLRGGAWDTSINDLPLTRRTFSAPNQGANNVGFRVIVPISTNCYR